MPSDIVVKVLEAEFQYSREVFGKRKYQAITPKHIRNLIIENGYFVTFFRKTLPTFFLLNVSVIGHRVRRMGYNEYMFEGTSHSFNKKETLTTF